MAQQVTSSCCANVGTRGWILNPQESRWTWRAAQNPRTQEATGCGGYFWLSTYHIWSYSRVKSQGSGFTNEGFSFIKSFEMGRATLNSDLFRGRSLDSVGEGGLGLPTGACRKEGSACSAPALRLLCACLPWPFLARPFLHWHLLEPTFSGSRSLAG